MTEKQKHKLLKRIRHRKLKRFEIEKFCTGKTQLERNNEIDILCTEEMIYMTSKPVFVKGVFKTNPDDLFEISYTGNDYLTNIKRDYIRTYLPICVYILSLIVAAVSLIMSVMKR